MTFPHPFRATLLLFPLLLGACSHTQIMAESAFPYPTESALTNRPLTVICKEVDCRYHGPKKRHGRRGSKKQKVKVVMPGWQDNVEVVVEPQ